MRILWHSTAPKGPSSYSVLTARVVPDLVRDKHEVIVSTWYGQQAVIDQVSVRPREDPKGKPIGGYVVLPAVSTNDYGVGQLLASYRKTQAEVCITCMDLWVLPPALLQQMKVAAWLPVDHDPCPDAIAASARATIYPMAFSEWGQGVLLAAGVDAHYVPCSADSSVYMPMNKKHAREKIGIPADTDFLVSMVAANKDPNDRKGFAEAIAGFGRFVRAGHPNARIYIHTTWAGPIDIHAMIARQELENNIAMPDQWDYQHGAFKDDLMRLVYSASDVLLNPAKSEGFGLPLVESQMCGTPIISTDFSTTRELLSAGWYLEGQEDWSLGANSYRKRVYIDGVVEALEAAYADRDNKALRKQARAGVMKYDTKRVYEQHWRPALKEIEAMVTGTATGKLQLVTF